MNRPRAIYAAFAISGVAGLIYEVLWTRYLSLYVGNGAYAQVLVLSVYLGGMAVGSMAVANVTRVLRRPLLWYAAAECVLALFGFAFHALYLFATEISYDVLFPALGSASMVGSIRWGIAGALILPQAIILGGTFPLMAAACVRDDEAHPGRRVARVYLLNTLGGAAGVLLAGFWMIGRFGLPGTSAAAALLNLAAAGIVWAVTRDKVGEPAGVPDARVEDDSEESERQAAPWPGEDGASTAEGPLQWAVQPRSVWVGLLTVTFGTAVASFTYEIGWIRMLSLVLGSATHAFELMLSAFILGLAAGAWLIRDVTDRSRDPLRLLGGIQVMMGLSALISLPLYTLSFDIMAFLVQTLPGQPGGYGLFNVSRYGLCLLVMLPATTLAGMTLPLITGSLLRAGLGEKAIGHVYGVNTMGSVMGAALAALVALPFLGLKGLIVAGAALDVLLGLWLLSQARGPGRRRWFEPAAALAASAVVFVGIGYGVHLTPTLLASGVFRRGALPGEQAQRSLYYQDGRTATVSAHIARSDGVIVLSTNGKPDASIGPRWLIEGRDTLPILPIAAGRDFSTQFLSPILAMAHHPDARIYANIGHGSGVSATTFLTSATLERLVTVEIEPLMVEGSLVFLPLTGPAFADPRATYVFDDAKSYFSYRQERFDVIFAEPSNPWVSGTASLFTKEFYARIAQSLAEGGILAQWIHIYESDDDLFLSVLAALDQVFVSYRAYLVGDADIAIVARPDGPLGEPDWGVLDNVRVRRLTAGAPTFTPSTMDALLLFDQSTFRALLDEGVVANSDYHPALDAGAERARFEQSFAEGAYSFATSRVDLGRTLSSVQMAPAPYSMVPSYGLGSAILWGRGAWLREAMTEGGGIAPEEFPEWSNALVHLQTFLLLSSGDAQLGSWEAWASGFSRAEADLHWGTRGWVDPTFYASVEGFLERAEGPSEARAAVRLAHDFSLGDWEGAASAADVLVGRVAVGERWAEPDVLLDMAVVAYLRTGRQVAARNAINLLVPRTGRAPSNLRNRLLDALVSEAERAADDGRASPAR